ncbi:type II toxin-antitoxin system RelE family toxin [Jatrophihabitans sp.]|uniref:type II toxin-antitoxin system RelE family toxin n=1 Tax=Jatrophihabitans sp. TaxID=1932789 RepID=UPI002EF1DE2E
MSSAGRYRLVIAPTARRQLAEFLPEAVAIAAYDLVVGPLLDNPHRIGKRLHPPMADRHSARRGTYRVIYRIDDEQGTVTVLAVVHRSDAYRSP